MAFGIYAFGHGGGVPGPIPGTPVGSNGNTNFALIPNLNPAVEAGLIKKNSDLLGLHQFWLIDCGPETMLHLCGVMPGSVPVVQNLKGIFLTHTHDDHSGGVKSLGYRARFVNSTKPMLIYPPELEPILLQQMTECKYLNPTVPPEKHGPQFFYSMIPTHTFGRAKDFTAKSFPVDHNCVDGEGKGFPAVGWIIATTHSSVVFSGDTARPLEAHYFKNADTIVHDVQFYNDGSRMDHVHCPYAWLRDAVPPEHRHKVWLTHTGHELPPEVKADGFAGLFRGGSLMVVK